jgi:hypothetical protein
MVLGSHGKECHCRDGLCLLKVTHMLLRHDVALLLCSAAKRRALFPARQGVCIGALCTPGC